MLGDGDEKVSIISFVSTSVSVSELSLSYFLSLDYYSKPYHSPLNLSF